MRPAAVAGPGGGAGRRVHRRRSAWSLAALYVYFRDLKFMVAAVILVWLYVTPIVYPASALGSAGPGSTSTP